MISKLRKKFILLSMLALFVLLSVIIVAINLLNYHFILKEADNQLTMMASNRGVFPGLEKRGDMDDNDKKGPLPDFSQHLSPEAPYEARYFSVLLNNDGNVTQTDTGRITAVDSEQAIAYAQQVYESNESSGFIEHYRFLRCSEGNYIRIIFLDCGQKLSTFFTFLEISSGMALLGYLIFFFVIFFFSGKMIRPAAESYEKQKRFITDAGHEIKTPLTIIQADADVLEMEYGENEWLADIQKQSRRLTALTNDLISLARMEERDSSLTMIDFPLSDMVNEIAVSFQAVAKTQDKDFSCRIQPMLSCHGNEKALRELIHLLLDNAMKYSPAKGQISLTLEKQGRYLQLSLSNTTLTPIKKEELPLFFERFYRADPSRSSESGGYGIGLAMAKAIVEAHGGKIQAKSEQENVLQLLVSLPL